MRFFIAFLLLLFINSLFAREVRVQVSFTYRPETYADLPTDRSHPWRPSKFKIQNQVVELTNNCIVTKHDTVCEAFLPNVDFTNFRGLNLEIETTKTAGSRGRGLLTLDLQVDGKDYFTTPFKMGANYSEYIKFNKYIRPTHFDNFPPENGHHIYTYQEGEFIGNIIHYREEKNDHMIRLVCIEIDHGNCVSFQIVYTNEKGERRLINQFEFDIRNLAAYKEKSKSHKNDIAMDGRITLPLTALVNVNLCVPILAPFTLPFDVVVLPITLPIGLAKRKHARNILNKFFNLTESKVYRVGENNYSELTKIFKNF